MIVLMLSSHGLRRPFLVLSLCLVALFLTSAGAAPAPASWRWPLDGPRDVITVFRAPSHDFGPGHRGVDLASSVGAAVRAPAHGVVAFRGTVVDRPLLTIDHGGGFVSTFEPMDSDLTLGDAVVAGAEIGHVATGGHTPAGQLHVGVRWNGVYINPMALFGDAPRAVLLPCCQAITPADGRAGTSP